MRDIALDVPAVTIPANTFCIYGDTRSGKTEFGATFPRPLSIVDVGERGYETIQTMDRSKWWEPEVEPIIKGIDQMGDLSQIIAFAQPLIASGRICSVIFDAFTFYADFYLSKLIELNPTADNRRIYGMLGSHLQWVRNQLHQLQVNVVWNCLAAPAEANDQGTVVKSGGPAIPGAQAAKFAAGVGYLMYSRAVQVRKEGKIASEHFELRTKQYSTFAAGNRLGLNVLPDPFIMGSYADLLPYLGYNVDDVRKAMKPIGAAASNGRARAATPAVRTPTVTVRTPTVTNRSAPKVMSPSGK